jgi:ubiquitin-like protein ATG12
MFTIVIRILSDVTLDRQIDTQEMHITIRHGLPCLTLTMADINNDTNNASNDNNNSSNNKVKIHLVAVGSAPLLKKTKFQLAADQRFAALQTFLRKQLKLSASDSLFLYCHSSFAPGPDASVGELRDLWAVRDELVVHYSLQEAWG